MNSNSYDISWLPRTEARESMGILRPTACQSMQEINGFVKSTVAEQGYLRRCLRFSIIITFGESSFEQ